MVELIDKHQIRYMWQEFNDGKWSGGVTLQSIIDRMPIVDAVPVVRCKDCKHYRNHPNGLCFAWTEPYDNGRGYKGEAHCVEPDDFCSYGERKNNGR